MAFALRLSVVVLLYVAVWFLMGLLGFDGSTQRLFVGTVMVLPTAYLLHRQSRTDDI